MLPKNGDAPFSLPLIFGLAGVFLPLGPGVFWLLLSAPLSLLPPYLLFLCSPSTVCWRAKGREGLCGLAHIGNWEEIGNTLLGGPANPICLFFWKLFLFRFVQISVLVGPCPPRTPLGCFAWWFGGGGPPLGLVRGHSAGGWVFPY